MPSAIPAPFVPAAPAAAPAVTARDIAYRHGDTRMIGRLCAPAGGSTGAVVLLLPDAYGVSAHAIGLAERLAALGRTTFVADLWGERLLPAGQAEFGPLIGAMAGDRARWIARVRAAHEALLAQPETAAGTAASSTAGTATGTAAGTSAVVALGYCFGGSSALEYARTGADLAGVVSVHGGLDIIAFDWSAARRPPVLLCSGAEDPMATPQMRDALTRALSAAGIDWQTHLYSGTVHAFSSPMSKSSARPDVVAYHPRSTARAWQATLRFLREADETPARDGDDDPYRP